MYCKNTFPPYTYKYISVVQIASEKASSQPFSSVYGWKAAKCLNCTSGVYDKTIEYIGCSNFFILQHVYSFVKHHPPGWIFKCTHYSKVLWIVTRSCYLTWPSTFFFYLIMEQTNKQKSVTLHLVQKSC